MEVHLNPGATQQKSTSLHFMVPILGAHDCGLGQGHVAGEVLLRWVV